MRASPAFEVSLHRFGAWRAAVLLLAALGLAAIAAWLITRERPIGLAALITAAFAATMSAGWAISLWRVPAVGLRWDGQIWHLGAPASTPDGAAAGELRVVIDLGPWMLLCFRAAEPERRSPMVWLPVQRRGLEAQWHALRCAVYSPRPAPGTDVAGEH